MIVPAHIRSSVRERLWAIADHISWESLPARSKTAYYEGWARDPQIGGILEHYMDRHRVRVYLKDTIMKDHGHSLMADESRVFRVLNIDNNAPIAETYVKPHGRMLSDGKIICWGRADDWKNVLMAVHERSTEHSGKPFAAVLAFALGKFHQEHVRAMVTDAARKLGIERVIWLDA